MRIAQSSHIYAHDYDAETQTLMIQFNNGAIYRYAGVPQTSYDSMNQSSSPGGYFHSKIKDRHTSEMVTAGPKRKK